MPIQDTWAAFGTDGDASQNFDVSGHGLQIGDMLVVAIGSFSNVPAVAIQEVVDDGGNLYTVMANSVTERDATFRTQSAFAWSLIGSVPTTTTVNMAGGGAEISAAFTRLTGVNSPETATSTRVTADDPTMPNVAASGAAILLAMITQDGVGSYTQPTNWTLQQEIEGSGFTDMALASREVGSGGSYGGTWPTGGSADYAISIVSLRVATDTQTLLPRHVGGGMGGAW